MRFKKNYKIRIILIAVIVVLAISITAVTAAVINSKKTKEVYVNPENVENYVTENDVLVVDVGENEIETNEVVEEQINETVNQTTTSNTGTTQYKLEINCAQNVVNVYTKDENGEYTNCVKAMLCSIGPATPRSGTYGLKKYGGWQWKGLFGDVYGQYATQITGNILFHSVPYTEKYNKSSLEYWEYNKLGTAASMGCIRLTVRDVKWIYDNCAVGTKVMFYSDSNPGPLGKPTAQKIPEDSECKGWDPTDPDENNPWRNAGKDKSDNANTETNTNTTQNTNTNTSSNTQTNTTNNVTNNEQTTTNTESKGNEQVNNTTNTENKETTNTQTANKESTNTENVNTEKTNTENK